MKVVRHKPLRGLLVSLSNIGDNAVRYREVAAELAKNLPGIDLEQMSIAMEKASYAYRWIMSIHKEGTRRRVIKAVSEVSIQADKLLDTLGKLGPWGRTMIFKDVDLAQQEFLQTDQEKWLLRLTTLAEDYREELEDTPFPGRPSGTTLAIKKARRSVLKRCSAFLAPFTIDQNGVLSNLVLEMARAIHRTELEPDLPMESQLFRKEWKEMQDVQKQDDRTNFLNN